MNSLLQNLEVSVREGFIQKSALSHGSFKPQLLVNNKDKNQYVLTTLTEDLELCESFLFSVAFITEGGLAMLKSKLLDLKEKGIRGRIITSTYLDFNKPKIFRELLKLDNVDVRITDVKGFHSKGYIFKHKEHYTLIVGSSNLTQGALKANHEWNIKLSSHENGEIIDHFQNQFEEMWDKSIDLTEAWINEYELTWVPFYQKVSQIDNVLDPATMYQTNRLKEALRINPNKMQESALQGIAKVREEGHGRALIISATGTGKTYLSAFDVRNFQPKRFLFIVHREQILQKAKSDFQKILGGNPTDYGILSGSQKETEARYLFATVQTLSKDVTQFDPDHFDYILIDEAHRAGANTYQKVIDYYQPKFLMGMTATPERSDTYNLYELFDYHIAYEIRLQEALEEEMLCPFHYFGVTDFAKDGELVDDSTQLTSLVNSERVHHVIEKIEYYGYSGDRVCGLIFCSRKDEAKELSKLLNEQGYLTVTLTGDDSQERREDVVRQLERGKIQYILTVDIFNEGVDIPSVNQVVMLRQTQSGIIFIQQLGRGLRKHDSKNYVTIIDFIGNYKNNYIIPIALSGDYSQNKDNIRRHVKDTTFIKGISTINFERVAKEQIFKSITDTKLTAQKILKDAYQNLKYKLGRQPKLSDFLEYDSIDPVALLDNYDNYPQFLEKMKEDAPALTVPEYQILTWFSKEFLNGKRRTEAQVLEGLLQDGQFEIQESEEKMICLERIFNKEFYGQPNKEKYGDFSIATRKGNMFYLNPIFTVNELLRDYLMDAIEASLARGIKYTQNQPFTLYEKYFRKDMWRLLNWERDGTGWQTGYQTKGGSCVILVKLHKGDEVEASVNYDDQFLNDRVLKWYTTNNRNFHSPDVAPILDSKETDLILHLFVKKDDDEGKDFYYLGKMSLIDGSAEQTTMQDKNGKELPVVTMEFLLEQPIEHNLYQYLTNN